MTERPRRQEQERATEDVTEVAPGILRAQLPIDMPGLGHVNCYVLEDERGVAIVDPGLPGRATLKTLTERLASAGIPLQRVHTVVVTHSHPDHFGGAGWVRNETGAEIVTHERFTHDLGPPRAARRRRRGRRRGGRRRRRAARKPWDPPPWGGEGYPFSFKRRMRMRASKRLPRLFRTPTPTQRLADRQTIRLAGREWVALHTPGHTEDHLCLFDPTERVMLSGDHVLPTITPHIGGMNPTGDPLLAFFESLDKVAAYGPDVSVVLPAHGHPFDDLAGRAKAIQEHHIGRLEVLRKAADEIGRPARVPGAVDAPVLGPGPGRDGRQRDVRPPRAPPPRRRVRAPHRPHRLRVRPRRLSF